MSKGWNVKVDTHTHTLTNSQTGAPTYYDWLRQEYLRKRTLMVNALQTCGEFAP